MSAAPPLSHQVAGEGFAVVLLNGGMMTFGSWQPVAARLEAHHRVLRFDFRGQLLSPGEPPADLAGHAADTLALLDAVGFESAHLVGASFGALVATELAAAHPERVRSLTLVTAMDRATPEFNAQSRGMSELLGEILAGGARERFWDVMVEGVYSADYLRREASALAARRAQLSLLPAAWFRGVERLLATVEGFDLTPALPAVSCRTCVVIAAGDRVMDAERSHALALALGAGIVVHPTAGHALVAEDPAWLAEVCRNFLSRAGELPR